MTLGAKGVKECQPSIREDGLPLEKGKSQVLTWGLHGGTDQLMVFHAVSLGCSACGRTLLVFAPTLEGCVMVRR